MGLLAAVALGCGQIAIERVDRNSDTATGAGLDGTDADTGPDVDADTDADTDAHTDTADACPDPLPGGVSAIGGLEDWTHFNDAVVTLEEITGQTFTQAWRAEMVGGMTDPTGTQMLQMTINDIAAGDVLFASFWIRCESAAAGECRTGFVFELDASPWNKSVQFHFTIDDTWRLHQIPFVAAADQAAGEVGGKFRLGYADQVLLIHPLDIVNYRDAVPIECLPRSPELTDALDIFAIPEETAVVGEEYRYRLEMNGPVGASVTARGLPAWLDLDGDDLFRGTPQAGDAGIISDISITADDGNTSDTVAFQLEVLNP